MQYFLFQIYIHIYYLHKITFLAVWVKYNSLALPFILIKTTIAAIEKGTFFLSGKSY